MDEFDPIVKVGQMVSFNYHGTRRIGEVVEAFGYYRRNRDGVPFGWITVDTKHDGFRRFSCRKMQNFKLLEGVQ
jgi:hypothetical protein